MREVRVVAASYLTAWDEALSNSEINKMNRGCGKLGSSIRRKYYNTHAMNRVLFAIQLDNLDNAHLEQFVHSGHLVGHAEDVLDCLGHSAVRQEHKRVPLARRIGFGSEECLNELRCIGNEVLEFAVDSIDGENGVFANVRMPMLQTRSADGDERFEEF